MQNHWIISKQWWLNTYLLPLYIQLVSSLKVRCDRNYITSSKKNYLLFQSQSYFQSLFKESLQLLPFSEMYDFRQMQSFTKAWNVFKCEALQSMVNREDRYGRYELQRICHICHSKVLKYDSSSVGWTKRKRCMAFENMKIKRLILWVCWHSGAFSVMSRDQVWSSLRLLNKKVDYAVFSRQLRHGSILLFQLNLGCESLWQASLTV